MPAARTVAAAAIREAAGRKNDPADLINVALEKLVEGSFELPGYTTLDEMAAQIREEVNSAIFALVADRIGPAGTARLDQMLVTAGAGSKSDYNRLKRTAPRPSWTNYRLQLDHLRWVDSVGDEQRAVELVDGGAGGRGAFGEVGVDGAGGAGVEGATAAFAAFADEAQYGLYVGSTTSSTRPDGSDSSTHGTHPLARQRRRDIFSGHPATISVRAQPAVLDILHDRPSPSNDEHSRTIVLRSVGWPYERTSELEC